MKADPTKTREWQRRGAERYEDKRRARAREPHPRPRKRKLPRNDSQWRAQCIELYGEWCRACGTRRNVQMDHMWPRSQGGPSLVENGLPLCREHHEQKTMGTLKIRPDWLTKEQRDYLADVGWVGWDAEGEPFGRGHKHFAAEGSEARERVE